MAKKKLKKVIKAFYYYSLCQLLHPTNRGADPYENEQLKFKLTQNVPGRKSSAVLLSIELEINDGKYQRWLSRKGKANKAVVSTISHSEKKVVVLLIGKPERLEKIIQIAWKGKRNTRVKHIQEKWFNKKVILNNTQEENEDSEISWSPRISNSIKHNLQSVEDIMENPNSYSCMSEKGSDEIVKAAEESGLFTVKFGSNIYVVSPSMKFAFTYAETSKVSAMKREVTNNKVVTKDILNHAGIPVPKGIITSDYEEARNYLNSFHKSIVVKPLEGSQGQGVSVDIQNEKELKIAWDYAKSFHESIILEELVCGTDIRILIFGGKARVAQMRVPAYIIGNGKKTVEDLVNEKNDLRLKNPRLDKSLIKIDTNSFEFLKRQKHTLTTTPQKGEIVFLHLKANLSAGGDNIIVTDRINPDLMKLAEETAAALDMTDFLGVDLLIEDMTLSRYQQDCKIIEVNSRAALRGVQYPLYGREFNAPSELVSKTVLEKETMKEFREKSLSVEITGSFNSKLKGWITEKADVLSINEDITIENGTGNGAISGKEDNINRFLVELLHWKDIAEDMFVDGVRVVESNIKTDIQELVSTEATRISPQTYSDIEQYIGDQPVNTVFSGSETATLTNMDLVLRELNKNGFAAESLTNELIGINKNGKAGVTGINPNSAFSENVCSKIYPVKTILAINGFPMLRGIRASCGRKQSAKEFLKDHQMACSLTFEFWNEARTYKLSSESRLNELCKKASGKGEKNFIIEEDPGSTHICVAVVGTKAVAALVVESPYIIGDGKNTVKSLIDHKNALRSENPVYSINSIELNDKLTKFIETAGYSMDEVLDDGEKLQIGNDKYWTTDGDTAIITDFLHDDFKAQAEKAVETIPGLKIAYVHMAVDNLAMAKHNQKWFITRIDTNPDLSVFHYPWRGTPYNLAKDVALGLCIDEEIVWKKDKKTSNMVTIKKIIDKVKCYHDENENKYPLQKRFHYNSRMYFQTKAQKYLNNLYSIKEEWEEKREWFIENAEAIPNAEYVEVKLDQEKTYRVDAIRKHYKIKHYNKLFFKALFQEQIFNEYIDLKQIINLDDIHAVRENLINDEESLLKLSTPAVNFLYSYNYFILEEDLDPEFLLNVGELDMNVDILSQYHAKIYFYTHAIIGASRFYTKPIEKYKEKYLKMLNKAEDLVKINYEAVSMDQKFELLVCANLLNTEISIKETIIEEALQSLSTKGDYFIDRFNKYNNEENKKTTFNKSEHRNVLAIMALYEDTETKGSMI